jgi:hypothetical protein
MPVGGGADDAHLLTAVRYVTLNPVRSPSPCVPGGPRSYHLAFKGKIGALGAIRTPDPQIRSSFGAIIRPQVFARRGATPSPRLLFFMSFLARLATMARPARETPGSEFTVLDTVPSHARPTHRFQTFVL